jgi:hypothetical protein|tara:strand:- start:2792 stop:3541 length:750 start_codon:yes stop_codon:yes gene_type:complete
MKNNHNFPLVISCALKPQVDVSLNDVEERLRQYKKSIHDWSNSGAFKKIVIVDNTGNYILSDFEIKHYSISGIEIEQIIYGPEDEVSLKGASWGQARIYENAIMSSSHISNSNFFATTTGRTFVPNANVLLKEFRKNPTKTYVNRWLSKGYKKFIPGRADLRFVIWNKEFFLRNISPLTKILDDSNDTWIEHVYDKIFEDKKNEILSFSSLPRVVGQAGHHGGNYDGTNLYKWVIKNFLGKITKINKYN